MTTAEINNDTNRRLKRRPLRHLSELRDGINVSFEYFPPRTEEGAATLDDCFDLLEGFRPRFSSVTHGAGGSADTYNFATLKRLSERSRFPIAAHLTHIGLDRGEVDALAERLPYLGIDRIVALRGDRPLDGSLNVPPGAYSDTAAMIRGLKRIYDFDISVAGYPETHPEAASPAADIEFLKRKVDAGANRVILQMCYDSDAILRFRDRARSAGIDVPIIPGVLPIDNFERIERFARRCGAKLPRSIVELFRNLPEDPDIVNVVSATVAAEFCTRLIDHGVTAFHFYTLNNPTPTRAICHILGLGEDPRRDSDAEPVNPSVRVG